MLLMRSGIDGVLRRMCGMGGRRLQRTGTVSGGLVLQQVHAGVC